MFLYTQYKHNIAWDGVMEDIRRLKHAKLGVAEPHNRLASATSPRPIGFGLGFGLDFAFAMFNIKGYGSGISLFMLL